MSETTLKVKQKFKLFKLYDYNVYDKSYIDDENDNNSKYKDNKKYTIQMFGINSKGYSASIFVEGFNPFFYIKVGDNWNDSTKTEFVSHLTIVILMVYLIEHLYQKDIYTKIKVVIYMKVISHLF